jgi:dTDP-4-dehydrorhamnose 3,5-epimerase-like enzyme
MKRERIFNLQRHEDLNGFLCVLQRGIDVDFDIRRLFAVSASEGDIRGEHAHKRCSQVLICVSGKVLVTCSNGTESAEYLLDAMHVALLVPPGLWAKQEYLTNNSLLIVLCDRDYEPQDYIHDYDEYKKFLQLCRAK